MFIRDNKRPNTATEGLNNYVHLALGDFVRGALIKQPQAPWQKWRGPSRVLVIPVAIDLLRQRISNIEK